MTAVSTVFEDDAILIVNKPAGLTVNRSQTQKEPTLEDWAATKISGVERSGIVHRLDKDTSGLLILAKTPVALENLRSQFKNRQVIKKYLALVHGRVAPEMGVVNAPISRSPFNRKHFGVFPGGREATTGYKVLKVYKDHSLLEVEPKTGRTHQIRVHLKYLGYPVVSDAIYGWRKQVMKDLKFCPRLFLHASFLQIIHPVTKATRAFDLPLPEDLKKAKLILDG